MNFDPSARTTELLPRLESFMDEHVYPNEARYFRESTELGPWAIWPVVEELKPVARVSSVGIDAYGRDRYQRMSDEFARVQRIRTRPRAHVPAH